MRPVKREWKKLLQLHDPSQLKKAPVAPTAQLLLPRRKRKEAKTLETRAKLFGARALTGSDTARIGTQTKGTQTTCMHRYMHAHVRNM